MLHLKIIGGIVGAAILAYLIVWAGIAAGILN